MANELLSYEEIEEKLENDWDGLDQPSLAQFVQDFTVAKLKALGYVKWDREKAAMVSHKLHGGSENTEPCRVCYLLADQLYKELTGGKDEEVSA